MLVMVTTEVTAIPHTRVLHSEVYYDGEYRGVLVRNPYDKLIKDGKEYEFWLDYEEHTAKGVQDYSKELNLIALCEMPRQLDKMDMLPDRISEMISEFMTGLKEIEAYESPEEFEEATGYKLGRD